MTRVEHILKLWQVLTKDYVRRSHTLAGTKITNAGHLFACFDKYGDV